MNRPIRISGSRQFGFTLIELMVVIVLIAIMTAMILPEMKGTYEDALLRSTARKLVDVCSLANSRSITINQAHRVRLDRKNGRYFIERATREGGKREGSAHEREIIGGEGTIDTRISIELRSVAEDSADPMERKTPSAPGDDSRKRGTADSISFYADGTADAQELLLRDRQGFRLALRINPITARVHIVELERE